MHEQFAKVSANHAAAITLQNRASGFTCTATHIENTIIR